MNLTASKQQFLGLLNRLVVDTRSGKVSWAPSNDLNRFTFQTTRGTVTISSRDGDGGSPYTAELFNDAPILIEELTSDWDDAGQGAFWNTTLQQLFESARSASINLEGVISGILEEIDKPKPSSDADFSGADDDIPF